MTDIRELAARRTTLEGTLSAIGFYNVSGKTLEELTHVEIQKIEAQRELQQVNKEIEKYINGE